MDYSPGAAESDMTEHIMAADLGKVVVFFNKFSQMALTAQGGVAGP